MKYLIDSHILLWALFRPMELKDNIHTILDTSNNQIYLSSVSIWEISLKYGIGKLDLKKVTPESLKIASENMGFLSLSLTSDEAASYYQLPIQNHRDPFDRMLVWQAIRNNMKLISKDNRLNEYKASGLQLIN